MSQIFAPLLDDGFVPLPNAAQIAANGGVTTLRERMTRLASDAEAVGNIWNKPWMKTRGGSVYAAYITKVIDLGTSVESTVGSGIWPANATGDGLHPSQAQESVIAAVIAPSFATASL